MGGASLRIINLIANKESLRLANFLLLNAIQAH